jgi:hypothetical protein
MRKKMPKTRQFGPLAGSKIVNSAGNCDRFNQNVFSLVRIAQMRFWNSSEERVPGCLDAEGLSRW